jgi:lipopolysaccharide heptosyltransferase I
VNVLVVRLSALGDIVHTVPAVAALIRARADARIDWLVERTHRPAIDLFDLDVRPIEIEGGSVSAFLWAMRGLRRNEYDVALDFQGLLKSALLARGSGARRVVGFSRRALREPSAAWFYSERIDPGAGGHVIRKNLALLSALGIAASEIRLPLKALPSRSGAAAVVLNPGAGWPNKQWPPERFGALAAGLRAARGLRSVVTWGPGEQPLAAAVASSSEGAAEIAPPTSLAELTALVASAPLVVSGDTGPIHLAAAAGTPIVGLYGPTDPARNGPWSAADVCVSRFETCVCHHKRRCHRASRCLDDISVEEVQRAAETRLDRAAREGA